MAFDIRFTYLQQETPFTANVATLLIEFEVIGIKPDFVQIYAVNYGESTPAGLGDAVHTVDMSITESQYSDAIQVNAGAIYTIWLCPRTGSKDNPDDQIDEAYWEGFCVGQTIVTKSVPLPATQRQPPVITSIDAERATMTKPDRITVTWTSQPYDKFLIWWTQSGAAMDQGEIDNSQSGGSWTAIPTTPGARYTFSVKGGVSGGIGGNYLYSDWGPTITATAPHHYSSLRLFLRASGINPGAQGLRSLMHQQHHPSLHKFMKLS
jgi:hypothetical protein